MATYFGSSSVRGDLQPTENLLINVYDYKMARNPLTDLHNGIYSYNNTATDINPHTQQSNDDALSIIAFIAILLL